MPSVDNRVVEMQFDNKQFENGVNTSIKSLDKLKKGLDLDKSAKSLSNLEKTAKGFNLSGIANGVETIASRFTTLGIIGVTALQNITTAAMNAGAQLVEALTIQPIKMGFQEYETQINAVQTILANTSSKGTTLQQVNDALDELNRYADLTIYNFTEMTRNIGTFTAAGVDLDTSVSAIKGIANLAAVSGSTSQQAATAMYQLSQALAAGTVKLMDWNSVVNAGMGGQVFQDALKETARVHGVAIDEMIEKEGSFRETLKDGWLTSEVLTETLAKFTGDLSEEQLKNMGYTEEQTKAIMEMGRTANDAATKVKTFTQLFDTLNEAMQSGWTQSWEYIIGDYEEAKETLTQLSDMFSDIINQSAEGRNQILKEWSELGGRTELFGALLSAIEAIFSYIKPVQEGFKEIIPPITGQKLFDLTQKLHQFMESMKLSEETANRVKEIAKNFAQAFKNIFDAVKNATGGFDGFKNGLNIVRNGVLDVLTSFSNFIKGLTEGISLSSLFSSALSVTGEGLSIFGRLLTGAANIVTLFAQGLTTLVGYMSSAFAGALGSAGSFASGFVTILQTIITTIPQILGEGIKAVGSVVRDILQAIPIREVNAAIQDTLFSIILLKISRFLGESKRKVEEAKSIFDRFGEIADSVKDVLESVQGPIKSFAKSIQANAILKIAIALGILAASLYALSQIPLEQLATGLTALSAGMLVFTGIAIGTLVALKKIANDAQEVANIAIMATQLRKIALSMLIFAAAVRILTDALKEVSMLSWDELIRGMVGLSGVIAMMIVVNKMMEKESVEGIIKMSGALIIFSVAVRLMTESVKSLGQLSLVELAKGIVGLIVVFKILTKALASLETATKGLWKSAASILIVSAALALLSLSVRSFNDVDFASIIKAPLLLIGIAAALKLLNKAMSKVEWWEVLQLSASLIVVSQTLKQFGEAAKVFNEVGWDSVGKLVTTMSSILATMAAFSAIATKTKFLEISGGLWAVSEAVRTFVNAARDLSSLDWPTLAKGIVGIGAGLGVMIFALQRMPEKLIVEKAASLTVLALSLRAMADAIRAMGSMDVLDLAKGLAGLAVSLGVIVKAVTALDAVKNLKWIGVSLGLIGLGLSMIAGPIKMMGSMNLLELAAGLGAMAAAFFIIFKATKYMGALYKDMLKTAAGLAAFGAAILVFGIALSAMMYPIQQFASMGIEGAITGVAGLALLIATMYGLIESANAMPDLSAKAVAKVAVLGALIGFLGIIVAQLSSIDSVAALQSATALAEVVLSTSIALDILSMINIPAAGKAIATLAIVIAGMAAIVVAMGGLAQIPGAKWIVNEGKEFLQSIGTAIGGFFGAIAGGFVGGAMLAASAALPLVGRSLSAFAINAKPFFDTVSKIDPGIGSAVANLAAAVLMVTGANILESATSWLTGGNSMEKFGESLAKFAPYMKEYSDIVKDVDAGAVEGSANAAKALAEMANSLPKEGGLAQWVMGSSDIVEFAQKLVPFGEALRDFGNVVKDIDSENISSATTAAQGLADLYNSLDNIGGMVAWFEGEKDFKGFSEGIVGLGEAIVAFGESIGGDGIDFDKISKAVEVLKSLGEIQGSLDNIGGMVSYFEGEKDVAKFAKGVEYLGTGISNFSNAVSKANFDEGKVTGSVNALKSLSEIQSTLPNIGGIASFFQGAPQMDYFARGVEQLGVAVTSYCNSISNASFDEGKVTNSIEALKALAEINNSLDNIGGIISFFEGEKDMSYFARGITTLGEAISSYCDTVSGKSFDEASISASVEAIKALSEVYNSLDNVGGLISFFEGERDMSRFAEGIESLGTAIAAYSDAISQTTIDPAQLAASVEAIKVIAEASQLLGNAGGLQEGWEGNSAESLKKFAGVLGDLGSSIASFVTNLGESDYTQVGPAVEAIKQVAEVCNSLNDFNEEGITKFKDSISDLGDMGLPQFNEELTNTASSVADNMGTLRDAISSGAQGIGEAFDNLKSKLVDEGPLYEDAGKTIGESLIKGLSEAITSNTFQAVNALKNVCKEMITAALQEFTNAKPRFVAAGKNLAEGVKSGFKSVGGWSQLGKDIVQGLANGISSNASIARDAAAKAASDALAAAKSALDSSSPSKKFMQLGKDSDLGLAIGMEKFTGVVTKSASNVASKAFDASADGIKRFNKLAVAATVDPLEAFRPVLDAATIRNQAMGLKTDQLAFNAAMATSSYGMPNPVLQVDNTEVVNALNDVQDQLNYIIQNGMNPEFNMYLDSKKFASTTARQMNRALGSISKRGGIV